MKKVSLFWNLHTGNKELAVTLLIYALQNWHKHKQRPISAKLNFLSWLKSFLFHSWSQALPPLPLLSTGERERGLGFNLFLFVHGEKSDFCYDMTFYLIRGATGPNVSWLQMIMSRVTSVRIVGWKKLPPSSWRWPPRRHLAPLDRASLTWLSTWWGQRDRPWMTQ